MRLWHIGSLTPGFYRDEAIEGLHGIYQLRAIIPADSIWVKYSRHPLWELTTTLSVAVLGPTVAAARLPAAVAGTAAVAVVLAFWTPGLGAWPTLAACGLVGGSLWSLTFGRIGHAPILVLLQGVLLLALMIRPVRERPFTLGMAAGVVAGSGLFSYYAGAHLPLALALGAVLRARGDREFLAGIRPWAAGALAGVACTAVPLGFRPGLFHDMAGYGGFAGVTAAAASWGTTLAGVVVAPGSWDPEIGFWNVWPLGGALLRPAEGMLVAGGLAALVAAGPARWLWAYGLGWTILALLPGAATAGGLRWSRLIGALPPLALLAAGGATQIMRLLPRRGHAVIVLAVCLIYGQAGFEHFHDWRRDPRVALWADRVDTETALYLRSRAIERPLRLANPLSYAANPHLMYLLDREIASGRIISAPPGAGAPPRLVHVIRDPLARQPAVFVFQLPGGRGDDRLALGLNSQDDLLAAGDDAFRRGDADAAERHYRAVLGTVPDFGLARVHLARVLIATGRRGEAMAELDVARRSGVNSAIMPRPEP